MPPPCPRSKAALPQSHETASKGWRHNPRRSDAELGSMTEFRELVSSVAAYGAETAERFAAERELCLMLAPRIRRYGLRHLRDETAAADLLQEALIVLLQASARVESRIRSMSNASFSARVAIWCRAGAATNGERKASQARCCHCRTRRCRRRFPALTALA